jgi:hypothetical protein
MLCGCSERGHDNPFDPQGSGNSPVSLSVTSTDNNTIRLNWGWRSEPVTDYSGFRIYRSTSNNQNYTLYREMSKNQFSFVDSAVQQYDWYYYKVSVFGPAVESAASQPEKIYLGQGSYWILSRYGFLVRKVSYDLLRINREYYTAYPPEEWAVDISDSLINLCFFRYDRGVSQLNLKKGFEDYFYYDDLDSPIDVEYDPSQDRIYVLDENGQSNQDQLHIIRNKSLERKIVLPQGNYLKLYLSVPNQCLIILEKTGLLKFSLTSYTITDSYPFAEGFNGQDMDASTDSIFVLSASDISNSSQIYRMSFTNDSTNPITISGLFYRITANSTTIEFYLAERISGAKDMVVKLSSQGTRLLQLPNLEYVEQMGLNPYDQSIVVLVLDPLGDQLVLYDNSGNEISRSLPDRFYDAIRIYIE